MAVSRPLLGNLLQLRNYPEFAPYREWLVEQREFWRNALETQKDTDMLRQAQGRAQTYKEQLDLIDKAQSLAEKERGKPHNAGGVIPMQRNP